LILSDGFPHSMVLLDLETTGGKSTHDRIIEVALIRIEAGEVVDRWQQLINPEINIPPWITRLTGISTTDVMGQPTFHEIADGLFDRLQGAMLVAHNARFDYGFLKNEFKRSQIDYTTKPLCSVKLSRALYPQFKQHGLDALIERFQLPMSDRHRAMADTEAILHFFDHISQNLDADEIQATCESLLKHASLPSHLPKSLLKDIPNRPGVYRFYAENGRLLYVGKSVALKNRILSHFSSDHQNPTDLKISQAIHHLDYETTPSDFSAQLLENHQIKRDQPAFNRRQTRQKKLYQLEKGADEYGYSTLSIVQADMTQHAGIAKRFGLFRSQKQATTALEARATRHHLCQRLTGLDKRKSGRCFAHQLKRCFGACIQEEPVAVYNERVDEALESIRSLIWPYAEPILIKEPNRFANEDEPRYHWHLVDQWVYYGQIESEEDLHSALSTLSDETTAFDLDTYYILNRFINQPDLMKDWGLSLVPISQINHQVVQQVAP
jgi:DNA polymerase-3 subunit epsilon